MEQSPWEADIRSANQGIPQLLCSMNIRYVGFEVLMSVTVKSMVSEL
jgi:hypothetical protein